MKVGLKWRRMFKALILAQSAFSFTVQVVYSCRIYVILLFLFIATHSMEHLSYLEGAHRLAFNAFAQLPGQQYDTKMRWADILVCFRGLRREGVPSYF